MHVPTLETMKIFDKGIFLASLIFCVFFLGVLPLELNLRWENEVEALKAFKNSVTDDPTSALGIG